RNVRIPDGFGCRLRALKKTTTQSGYRTALRAVDLQREQVVPAHAHAPGRIEVRDDAARELEGRVRRVVGRRLVLAAGLVPAPGDVRRAEAAHRAHLAEQVVEHVAPVAQHVEDDPAAVLHAVVPGRTLRGGLPLLAITLEDPVAEFAAHG